MNHNPFITGNLQPIQYDLKVAQLERAILRFDIPKTFKYVLDENHFLLCSRRIGKKYRLLIATTDLDTDHYRYEPFIDADYYLMEKFYDKLLGFFAEYTEYLEVAPEFLW